MKKRKAQSQYLSWIIIIGMVITISFFLYNWSLQQARQTGESLEARTDPLVCSEIGISIDGICQDQKSIQMNITNTNNLEVSSILVRMTGLYPEDSDYLVSEVVPVNLLPGDSSHLVVLKKNTLSQVNIIPIAKKNRKDIHCEDKALTKEKSELKQC